METDHIYPINDEREHKLKSLDCPCGPRIDWSFPNPLVIHRSWDGREFVEEAERIKEEVGVTL